MAFCSSCGAQIADGAAFCSSCGAPQGGAVANAQPQTPVYQQNNSVQAAMAARQDALAEMDRMLNHFGQKRDKYNRYDELTNLIGRSLRVRAVPLLVFGILITLSCFITVIEGATGALVGLFIGLGMIGGYIAINVTRKNRLNNWTNELYEVSMELEAHYTNFGPCLIGMEYSNPSILASVKDTIIKGRADSPKEAINVMLDDAHKSEMEALAVQTAIASRQAANSAGAAAGFAAASFFFK